MPTTFHWTLAPRTSPAQRSPAIAFGHAAYVQQLRHLLPPGAAFAELGPSLEKIFEALAEELARVDERGVDLIDESDPRTADETIAEWEAMLGLPDEQVTEIPATLAERRLAVTQKYISRGGQSVEFFVLLAAACGYTIEDVTLETPDVDAAELYDTTGGVLEDGTYYYRVSAISPYGESIASAEMVAVVPAGTLTNQVIVRWVEVDGATGYRIFGRAQGAELCIGQVSGGATVEFIDDGSVTPGDALPAGPNPLAYKGIEKFANSVLRANFRADDRSYDAAYAYAMQVNAQTPAGAALAQADFERVIRHAAHSHIQVIFTYHP